MDDLSTDIKVIGIGGAGINIVSGILNNDFLEDAELIVMDMDWRALNNSSVAEYGAVPGYYCMTVRKV